MSFLVSWLVLSVVVWVTSLLLPGFYVRGFGGAMLVAALLGAFHYGVGFLAPPFFGPGFTGQVAVFGVGAFVNAILLQIADAMTDRLTIDSFGWALAAAVSISALGAGGEWAVRSLIYCAGAAGSGGLCL